MPLTSSLVSGAASSGFILAVDMETGDMLKVSSAPGDRLPIIASASASTPLDMRTTQAAARGSSEG